MVSTETIVSSSVGFQRPETATPPKLNFLLGILQALECESSPEVTLANLVTWNSQSIIFFLIISFSCPVILYQDGDKWVEHFVFVLIYPLSLPCLWFCDTIAEMSSGFVLSKLKIFSLFCYSQSFKCYIYFQVLKICSFSLVPVNICIFS